MNHLDSLKTESWELVFTRDLYVDSPEALWISFGMSYYAQKGQVEKGTEVAT